VIERTLFIDHHADQLERITYKKEAYKETLGIQKGGGKGSSRAKACNDFKTRKCGKESPKEKILQEKSQTKGSLRSKNPPKHENLRQRDKKGT